MYDDQDGCEWVFLLVPAYSGCPGPKAVKRLCVFLCVCVCVMQCIVFIWQLAALMQSMRSWLIVGTSILSAVEVCQDLMLAHTGVVWWLWKWFASKMSAGGRQVGKVTVSRLKPLTSRSHSEHSGINQSVVNYYTVAFSNSSVCSTLVITSNKLL